MSIEAHIQTPSSPSQLSIEIHISNSIINTVKMQAAQNDRAGDDARQNPADPLSLTAVLFGQMLAYKILLSIYWGGGLWAVPMMIMVTVVSTTLMLPPHYSIETRLAIAGECTFEKRLRSGSDYLLSVSAHVHHQPGAVLGERRLDVGPPLSCVSNNWPQCTTPRRRPWAVNASRRLGLGLLAQLGWSEGWVG